MGRASEKETSGDHAGGKLKGKHYLRELKKLHVELVKLQEWVRHKGLKVCIVFEGRDGAGKGGTIKAITERVSPACSVSSPCRLQRSTKMPDVLAALCPPSPRGGRNRDLRSELVQPAQESRGSWDSVPRSKRSDF